MKAGMKYNRLKEKLERLLEGLLLPGINEPVPVPVPVRNRKPHPDKGEA
ncbi:MAG: hypothetical protein JW965_10950 [Bacteroidales bacterium]|nr:hypothetical protein [Bacteroidales bacterium]